MTMRAAVLLGFFGFTIAVLGLVVVIGSMPANVLAAGLIALEVGGLAAMARRRGSVTETLEEDGALIVGTGVMMGVLLLGAFAPASGPRAGSGWAPVLAVGASVVCIVLLAAGRRALLRREGVERQVFVQATSIAFCTTIAGSAVYALFEVLAEVPALPVRATLLFALAAWAVATAVLERRTV